MKITGARNDPYPNLGRRAADRPAAAAPQAAARSGDSAAFLGVPAAELTPSVQGALTALLAEVDGLRQEVARLKALLVDAEGLADRDALTPLLNRRALLRELGRIRTFALRYGAKASLVYFDLDDLKSVNDGQGHAAGDAALTAVAERLSANIRDSDIAGRMGGDEFAVILVQADAGVAEAKAAQLAQAVEREPVRLAEGAMRLRLSWGVCEITEALEPEAIVAAADAEMYRRKRTRRPPPT